jgi:hypothetical protein
MQSLLSALPADDIVSHERATGQLKLRGENLMGTRPVMLLAAIVLGTAAEARAQNWPGMPAYAPPVYAPPMYAQPMYAQPMPGAYAHPGYAQAYYPVVVAAPVGDEPGQVDRATAAVVVTDEAPPVPPAPVPGKAVFGVPEEVAPDHGAPARGGEVAPSCGGHGCGGCCDSCCQGCCDCCDHRFHPFIEFQATTSYLRLEQLDNAALLTDGGVNLLDAGDFDFDHELSLDAGGVVHLSRCWGVEGRYLRLENVEDSIQFAGAAGSAAIATTPPIVLGAPTDANATFASFLQSAELGLSRSLWRGHDVRFLAQFRYLELNQDLNLIFNAPGTATPLVATAWGTRNNLYGGQIGVAGHVKAPHHHVGVDGFLKAGLYYNDAEGDFLFQSNAALVAATDTNSNDRQLAFVGEAALYLSYDVSRHVRVRGGYHVLIFEGVAVATDQVAATGSSGAVLNLNDNGRLLFHGPSVSVVASW